MNSTGDNYVFERR